MRVYPVNRAAIGNGIKRKMNPILKNQNKKEDKNDNKNKKRLTTKDDEMQDPEMSRERKEDPYESCPGSSNTAEKKMEKLPRVVLEEILLDTRVIKKTRPGPKSQKERKMFGNVKPNASSPPPPEGMDCTTDEERQGSNTRPSSTIGATTDVANLSDFSGEESNDSAASVRTSASGAMKRGKKALPSSTKKARGKVRRDRLTSSEDEEEENNAAQTEKRKQGRPVTTGKGVEIRARVAAKKELQNLEKEKKNIEKILEGSYDPTEYRGGRHSKRAQDMGEEIQNLPSRDIAAQMIKAARQVESVATSSSNLKGGYIKILKDAALQMALGVDALVCRSLPQESENAREMERLRGEIKNLREEVEKLRAKKEKEEQMPTPQDQQGIERMEIEEENRGGKGDNPPSLLHPTHPPKNKWPAVRPAIQGVRKNLSDGEEEILTSQRTSRLASEGQSLPPRANLERKKEIDVRKILEEKFHELSDQISSQIKEEVGRLFPTRVEKTSPLPLLERGPDRARKNAPNVPTPRRDAEERPVPAGKGKGKKGKSEGETESLRQESITSKETKSKAAHKLDKEKTKTTPSAEEKKEIAETWAKVVGRKTKEGNKRREGPIKTTPPSSVLAKKNQPGKKVRRRVPRTAAVVLTCPNGQYAETMAEIRAKVKLSEVGIQGGIITRTAVTGALVLEVPGAENGPKADALASRMREVLQDKEGIKINRPTKTADIRVRGLECSITKEEITEAVAEKGGCRTYEIQTGEIRRTTGVQGSLWMRLPLVAAKKATEGGTIQIGWSKVKITLLEARPLRCYKCLERGHVRERCPNSQDRSDRCYRCGESGHIARECKASPKCPICADISRKADHTLGSQQCTTRVRRGKIGENNTSSPPEGTSSTAQHIREEEKDKPKPQRVPRSGGKKVPSTPTPEEEEMETEPLEEREKESNK